MRDKEKRQGKVPLRSGLEQRFSSLYEALALVASQLIATKVVASWKLVVLLLEDMLMEKSGNLRSFLLKSVALIGALLHGSCRTLGR